MADDEQDTIQALWAALPLGAVIVGCAARIGSDSPGPILYGLGCGFMAIGLWTGPEALEALAERPGSRLRPFAGTARAFLRVPLAGALLLFAAAAFAFMPVTHKGAHAPAAVGFAVLLVSFLLAVQGWPSMIATWHHVGMLLLRVETKTVKPGGTVAGVAEMSRPCRNLRASLVLVDSKAPAAPARYDGEVSPAILSDGAWTVRVTARVPEDALPTLGTDGDGSAPWRIWTLELTATGGFGAPTTRSEPLIVA